MKNNNKYWNKAYRTEHMPLIPSQFAAFTLNELNSEEVKILDIGCGNGRDSRFFGSFNKIVLGVDASPTVIEMNEDTNDNPNVSFKICDFSEDITKLIEEEYDVIYSRFFFHAISEEMEEKVFQETIKVIKPGARLFAEFRTDRDTKRIKIAPKHFRRYIQSEVFVQRLETFDFSIEYICEGIGYAKYKDEDAHVCRVIAKKSDLEK